MMNNQWVSKTGRFTTLAFSFGLIAGCSITPPKSMMDIQAGETFSLQQTITIPAEKARTYIQDGKVTGSQFDRYQPHCRIEIAQLQTLPSEIKADHFRITRVMIDEEEVAWFKPIQVASLGMMLAFGDNQRPPTMDIVHLYLSSAKQPNVFRLTCAGALSDGNTPFDAPERYRPERQQINQILGEIGSIHK